jgi:hypothetical protein
MVECQYKRRQLSEKVKGTIETTPGNYEFVAVNANNFNARINNTFKAVKIFVFNFYYV